MELLHAQPVPAGVLNVLGGHRRAGDLPCTVSALTKGIEMQSFTYMSEDGVKALAEALKASIRANGQYEFAMNERDAEYFVHALAAAYAHTADGGCPDAENAEFNPVKVSDWAGDTLSVMGETVGVEFI